jgi:hypothetical protein
VRTAAILVALAAGAVSAAAGQVPARERQIAWAVAAAPERLRPDATVLGYGPDGRLTTLRQGSGLLVCLADDPGQPNHHVACYHRDLDPFMRRGRELRAAGLAGPAIDSARLAEIRAGRLRMPAGPAALYQLMARPGSADPATGEVRNPNLFHVVYVPYATPESTGLGVAPIKGPWLMDAGLPWAHIMITP